MHVRNKSSFTLIIYDVLTIYVALLEACLGFIGRLYIKIYYVKYDTDANIHSFKLSNG